MCFGQPWWTLNVPFNSTLLTLHWRCDSPDLAAASRPFRLDRHVARAAEARGTAAPRHSGHVAYIAVRRLGREVVRAPRGIPSLQTEKRKERGRAREKGRKEGGKKEKRVRCKCIVLFFFSKEWCLAQLITHANPDISDIPCCWNDLQYKVVPGQGYPIQETLSSEIIFSPNNWTLKMHLHVTSTSI